MKVQRGYHAHLIKHLTNHHARDVFFEFGCLTKDFVAFECHLEELMIAMISPLLYVRIVPNHTLRHMKPTLRCPTRHNIQVSNWHLT